MSEDLEAMADTIFDNRVPPTWTKKGFLSLKILGSWIGGRNNRINFLKEWIKSLMSRSFVTIVFKMTYLLKKI